LDPETQFFSFGNCIENKRFRFPPILDEYTGIRSSSLVHAQTVRRKKLREKSKRLPKDGKEYASQRFPAGKSASGDWNITSDNICHIKSLHVASD
jgi:hypothetical protein